HFSRRRLSPPFVRGLGGSGTIRHPPPPKTLTSRRLDTSSQSPVPDPHDPFHASRPTPTRAKIALLSRCCNLESALRGACRLLLLMSCSKSMADGQSSSRRQASGSFGKPKNRYLPDKKQLMPPSIFG